jgi:predicted Fe-Mo cluster-binding NifX family protein
MRICIPTDGEQGLGAAVAPHLGRAPFLTLVDTESGEVAVLPAQPHGDRSCTPADSLAGTGVEAVVCLGAGKRAVATLEAAGIRVLLTRAPRVDEAVAAARRGGLSALRAKDACGGQHHHHGSSAREPGRCRQDPRA